MSFLLIGILVSYLLGSIPTSYLIGRWVGRIDIRQHGSGNAGATNVNRTLGSRWGFAVLAIDAVKGVLAATLLPHLFTSEMFSSSLNADLPAIFGAIAIIGHIWSPFLSFRGGKGVATSAGVFGVLCWPATLAAAIICIALIAATRYVSVGSLAAAITLPTAMAIFKVPQTQLVAALVISVIVVRKHKENIQRLILRQENRLHFKWTKS